MLNALDDLREMGTFIMVVIGMIFMAISGLFFGITYWLMDQIQTSFQGLSCTISNNTLVSTCQELFNLGLYPILELREILVWFSFFFIFALVIGMLLTGYRSGKSPALMGFMVVYTIGVTYLAIEISNIYRTLLENDVFRPMMVDFTVYNKIMLYFPWFIFFVTILSLVLAIVNFQKPNINKDEEINNY